ncbi:unnamed protein product [Citrullus colocynthis]|uniref:Uncharacterized protein n=1 Tax=Citrullus colocynthis TaxID=252529 RepID=A0ABP0YFW6_9ROSI
MSSLDYHHNKQCIQSFCRDELRVACLHNFTRQSKIGRERLLPQKLVLLHIVQIKIQQGTQGTVRDIIANLFLLNYLHDYSWLSRPWKCVIKATSDLGAKLVA